MRHAGAIPRAPAWRLAVRRVRFTVPGGLFLLFLIGALVAAANASAFAIPSAASASRPRVLAIRFGPDLEVNPVTKDYVDHQLDEAAAHHYAAAIIELDTPGGLSSTAGQMRGRDLVLVGAELWHAHGSDGRELESGQDVRIDALDGLELTVTPLNT
jgi:membrane-bound ClpP family serine protease